MRAGHCRRVKAGLGALRGLRDLHPRHGRQPKRKTPCSSADTNLGLYAPSPAVLQRGHSTFNSEVHHGIRFGRPFVRLGLRRRCAAPACRCSVARLPRIPNPRASPRSWSRRSMRPSSIRIAAADPVRRRVVSSPPSTFPGPSCSSSPRSTPRRRCWSTRSRAKDYRGVYVDLQSASVHGHQGVRPGPGGRRPHRQPDDEPADSWDEENKTVAFDGDWKKAKIDRGRLHQDLHRCRRPLRQDALDRCWRRRRGQEVGILDCRGADCCLLTLPIAGRLALALDYELPQLGAWLSGRASPSHGGGHWFESI